MPRYWLIFLFPVGIALTASALTGGTMGGVLAAWASGAIILPVLLAAVMVGMYFTVPLARARAFDDCGWPDGARLVLATALGLGALSLGVLALGSIHLLGSAGVLGLLVLAAGVGYLPTRDFLRHGDRNFWDTVMGKREWLPLSIVPLSVMSIAVTFPPGRIWHEERGWYDVLEYHLEMPREYVESGTTAPVVHNAYSYLPANVEMLYTLAMTLADRLALGSYWMAVYPSQMLHAAIMVLAAAGLALAPLRMKPAGRVLAFLLVLAVPWTLIIGSQAYDDAGVLLYGALAMVWALRPGSTRTVAVTIGACIGLAVGCKLTAGLMIAIPVAVIWLLRRQWVLTTMVTAAAIVAFAPWALRDVAATGNPVFPIATRTLGLGHWTAQQAATWDAAHGSSADLMSRAKTLARASLLEDFWSPSAASVQKWTRDPHEPGGTPVSWPWRVGFLWVFVPIGLLLSLARGRVGWEALLVAALQLAAWLAATHLQSRFLLPALLPLALLMGISVERLATWRLVATMAVVLQALFAPFVMYQDLKNSAPPTGGITSSLASTGLLSRSPQSIIWPDAHAPPPPNALTAQTPRGIMLVGGAAAFYFRWPVTYNTVWDRSEMAEWLRQFSTQEVVEHLQARKVKYVVVDWVEIERLRKDYGYDPQITPESLDRLTQMGLQKSEAGRPGLEVYVLPD